MNTDDIKFKKPESSFLHEEGKMVFADGSSFDTEVLINIENISMLAKKGEDKTIIYMVSGEYIIVDKPFSITSDFIGNKFKYTGAIEETTKPSKPSK